MATASTQEILQARFSQLKQKSEITNDSSIENTVVKATNNTSIETKAVDDTLPQAITELITGSEYWVNAKSNRYRIIREGHLEKLLELARMAHSKDNPANWFAEACSKAAWERHLLTLRSSHRSHRKLRRLQNDLEPRPASLFTSRYGRVLMLSVGRYRRKR